MQLLIGLKEFYIFNWNCNLPLTEVAKTNALDFHRLGFRLPLLLTLIVPPIQAVKKYFHFVLKLRGGAQIGNKKEQFYHCKNEFVAHKLIKWIGSQGTNIQLAEMYSDLENFATLMIRSIRKIYFKNVITTKQNW